MLAELLHGEVALLLTQVAMQRLCVVSILDKFVGNLLRFNLCPAEDNGKNAWVVIHDALQCQVFVTRIHHIINVVHVLGTLVSASHYNLLVVV